MRRLGWIALLLGGCSLITSPGDYEDGQPVDGGRRDAPPVGCAADSECTPGVCEDAVCADCRDADQCSAGAPVCNEGSCGPCEDTTDCAPHGGVCASSGACVECESSGDCTDPARPVCNTTTNDCVPCETDDECMDDDLPFCVEGSCVVCTATDDSVCGTKSCDLETRTCTDTDRDSVRRCGECVADSECADPDDRCVPMFFAGMARPGGYCLPMLGDGCSTDPYRSPTTERVSLSGADPARYCSIRETVTTCEAVLDLLDDVGSCLDDSDCGALGLDDGRCEIVNTSPMKCTYTCTGNAECPDTAECGGGYCGGTL
ncbi:MAG: hypothetical protein CMN30_07145 [Sandaracinus sp.]|nr:hypothetical protein [Sandaracinus sp.]|tara:strand:+ start:357 stop:1307 length:951 start_codon:yes stop_codon:yes gene_type:complete